MGWKWNPWNAEQMASYDAVARRKMALNYHVRRWMPISGLDFMLSIAIFSKPSPLWQDVLGLLVMDVAAFFTVWAFTPLSAMSYTQLSRAEITNLQPLCQAPGCSRSHI